VRFSKGETSVDHFVRCYNIMVVKAMEVNEDTKCGLSEKILKKVTNELRRMNEQHMGRYRGMETK